MFVNFGQAWTALDGKPTYRNTLKCKGSGRLGRLGRPLFFWIKGGDRESRRDAPPSAAPRKNCKRQLIGRPVQAVHAAQSPGMLGIARDGVAVQARPSPSTFLPATLRASVSAETERRTVDTVDPVFPLPRLALCRAHHGRKGDKAPGRTRSADLCAAGWPVADRVAEGSEGGGVREERPERRASNAKRTRAMPAESRPRLRGLGAGACAKPSARSRGPRLPIWRPSPALAQPKTQGVRQCAKQENLLVYLLVFNFFSVEISFSSKELTIRV
jgi:hypothetical protein